MTIFKNKSLNDTNKNPVFGDLILFLESRTWQCEDMTCVDPEKLCEHAQYKTCSSEK